jgi:hypothetical protein
MFTEHNDNGFRRCNCLVWYLEIGVKAHESFTLLPVYNYAPTKYSMMRALAPNLTNKTRLLFCVSAF